MTNNTQVLKQFTVYRDALPDAEYTDELLRHERHTLLKAYGRQALVSLCTCGKKYLRVVDNIIDEYIKSL